jgi:6-phosphogluconate dehydrogenase
MVHNGIEYADMQLICEAYYLMKHALGQTAQQTCKVFADWAKGALNSYLIEITADILSKKDAETGNPLVEMILDKAGQKGTGAWTSQTALELGIAIPTITEAVFARCISAIKAERTEASKQFKGPSGKYTGDKKAFIEALRDGLYASKICSYAQGFALMAAAAKQYGWQLNFSEIAAIWRGGCIIRAQLLNRIKDAFARNPNLANLLLDDYLKDIVQKAQSNWRKAVSTAIELGIAAPGFSSALNYFDSYRTERLSANMIQAQRDYFGAHTYERIDKEGTFHTEWLKI